MTKILFTQTFTNESLPKIADEILQHVEDEQVITFWGAMGAGKTTTIAALCKALGVTDRVTSPTFALINEYEAPGHTIYHMDWYRLNTSAEATAAGIEDTLLLCHDNKTVYCFIEWPERAPEILPERYLKVELEHIAETERKITILLVYQH